MIKRIFPKSEFWKNVLTLTAGTVLAQAIPILISPVLTRIYSPESFGLLALFLSFVSLMAIVSNGRFELATLLPKHDIDGFRVLQLAVVLSLVLNLVFLVVFAVSGRYLNNISEFQEFEKWIYLTPVASFFLCIHLSLTSWFNRKNNYGLIARNKIVKSLSEAALAIILGYFTVKSGMIIGYFFSYLAASVFLYLQLNLKLTRVVRNKFAIVKQMKKFVKFPLYMVPAGFAQRASVEIPVFMLTSLYGIGITGYFSLAQKVLVAPIALVSSSIGNVYRQKAGELFAEIGECRSFFVSTFKKLLVMAVIAFPIGYLLAIPIFEFVYGSDWQMSGKFAKVLMVMFFCQFITTPVSTTIYIAGKQQYVLILQVSLIIAVSLTFFLCHHYNIDVLNCIRFYALIYSVKYIVELYMAYRFSKG